MELQIVGLKNFSTPEQAKIIEACKYGPAVISSNLFKLAVVYSPLTETRGLKPLEVYEKFMRGGDPLSNGTSPEDQIIQINLEGYFSFNRVVGWTNLYSWKSYINKRFLRKFDSASILGNIIHEAMHRMGYTHMGVWKTSVPYTYGNKVAQVYRELDAANILMPNSFLENKANIRFNLIEIS
jgi:hypothetical protein